MSNAPQDAELSRDGGARPGVVGSEPSWSSRTNAAMSLRLHLLLDKGAHEPGEPVVCTVQVSRLILQMLRHHAGVRMSQHLPICES